MTLPDGKEGQWLVVVKTHGFDMTRQSFRMGINEGAKIQLHRKIPGGPIIISKNQLEIAVGRQLALAIEVEPL